MKGASPFGSSGPISPSPFGHCIDHCTVAFLLHKTEKVTKRAFNACGVITNAKRVTEGSPFSKVPHPYPPPHPNPLSGTKSCPFEKMPQSIWASNYAPLKQTMRQFMSHFRKRASLSTNVIVKRDKRVFMLLFPFIICLMPVQSNPCSCRDSGPGCPPPPDATCCQYQPPPSSSSWATN